MSPRSLLPLAAVPVAFIAACGTGAVPPRDLERAATAELTAKTGVKPKGVECPEGLDAKVGAMTTCVLTLPDGERFDLELTASEVAGEKVNFSFKVGEKAK